MLRLSILLVCRFIVARHATSELPLESDFERCFRSCRERFIEAVCDPFRFLVDADVVFTEDLISLQSIRVQSPIIESVSSQ